MQKRGDTPVPGYTLTTFLGRGGYGEVWQATAPGGAPAALKFVGLNGAQGLKEFRGVERIKAIRHANLLPIHAFWAFDTEGRLLDEAAIRRFTAGGAPSDVAIDTLLAAGTRPATLIMAMPLGDKNLAQRLTECRAAGMAGIPPAELLDALEDAARAIDYLNTPRHDLGEGPVAISHADVKPQNIMLVGTSAQLCDFGLARVLGPTVATTSGAGTPAYIAPEILADRVPTPTSDQYSLGVSYVELRTGRLPFSDCESYMEVLDAHLKGKLDLSALPDEEQAIIKRATARQPADRYANCLEMVRALRTACGALPGAVKPVASGLQDTQDLTATPITPVMSDTVKRAPVLPEAKPTETKPPEQPPAPAARPSGQIATWQIVAGVAGLAAAVAVAVWMSRPPASGTQPGKTVATPETDPTPTKAPPTKAKQQVDPKADPKTDPEHKQVPPAKVEDPKVSDPPKNTPDTPPLAKSLQNSVGMTLVLIPAGKFTMGSTPTESQRGPYEAEHDVEFARPFYLGAHEVTQAQFQEVLGKNPSHFSATGGGRQRLGEVDAAKLPVESVAYADAVEFCEKLTARPAEQAAKRTYRLPTEAEWEYACRAGTTTPFSSGDALLPRFARCDFGPGGGVPQPKLPAVVGSLAANPWGLFDMHGNVAEWCLDWYAETPAGGIDPRGPERGTHRLIRGGGFYDTPAKTRSADRFHAPPATKDMAIGFRVLSVPGDVP